MAEKKKAVVIRNQLLRDIQSQLQDKEANETVEVDGHKYYMTTLNADEESWADTHSDFASEVSAYTSLRRPRLSAAIKKIDGKNVEDLFEYGDGMEDTEKELYKESKYRKRKWIMTQMMLVLGETPNKFVVELWEHYTELIKRRDKGWDELKKSSARTHGGESKDTSSQEKESSSVTPTSPE